ncbi:MAG: response regulator [Roseiflexaceae bacterium]
MIYQSTVLIVDDEPSMRNILTALLQNQGYRLVLATNGIEALNQAAAVRPDVILLDVMMPGLDGFEVCRRIRATPHLADVSLLLITALDDRDSRLQGIEAGADDFISKPFDRFELRARVRMITQLNRSRRLMLERAKFERVVELSPNGIMVLDADETILLANPAMLRMLGVDADASVIGAAMLSFIAAEQAERFAGYLNAVISGPEQSARFESMLIRPDSARISVEVDAGHFVWELRPAAQIVVRDITERQQAEALARRQIERLAALRTIDTTISSSLDLNVTLSVVLDQAVEQLQVDAAAVLLRKPYTQTLEYTAVRGLRKESLVRHSLHVGEGCAGLAALHRHMVRLPGAQADDGAGLQPPLGEAFPNYFGVPLIVKGQVEGVLELFHRTIFEPDAEWLHFLETLASQAAVAIDQAMLLQSLRRSNVELMRAYDTTLEGWARALELRDKETEGHAQRVTDLTVLLARRMGIGEADLAHMRRGALLHDIGKMGIPDSILLKPGPLNEDEWAIMRQHPVFAYDLLAPVAYLGPALDIPYCHHEKWDGTGYPRGLKGEQIPLSARIFAVVDIWDALHFDRPYRKGWPEDRVREHIRVLSGTHFDPQIVKAFLRLDMVSAAEPRLALLLVDDEAEIVETLRRALCDEFALFTANSGPAALEILRREEIAVILADQRMPGMTGVQLLEQARHIRPTALGILCSGYFDNAALSEALNLGTVRGFIPKPWQLTDLRRRVNEVVQQYRASAHNGKELHTGQT